MTIKTDFMKLEAMIKEAESLPKEKGTISEKEFSDILSKMEKIIQNSMTLIWAWSKLNYVPQIYYYHLRDSTDLDYKGCNEILIEVLYYSREKILAIDPTLGIPAAKVSTYLNSLISIASTPDEFYKKLIEEINFLYNNNRYTSSCLLLRKLFENLLIDILRKKYSSAQIDLYYNRSKGMFQNFSILLDNLEIKIDDFKSIDPNFNKEAIRRIEFYRERGNSSAHSISTDITKKEIDDKKEDMNYLVVLLIRILNNIN